MLFEYPTLVVGAVGIFAVICVAVLVFYRVVQMRRRNRLPSDRFVHDRLPNVGGEP